MNKELSSSFAQQLEDSLKPERVNELGLMSGFVQRLRVVTPIRLVVALISSLGSFRIESIADLLRGFNFLHGTTTAYKAFYNRLARPGFPKMMRMMFERLLEGLAVKSLSWSIDSPLARFRDIIIQDGTSFAIKHSLQRVFPGRFTTADPAAVEIHLTYSAVRDEALKATLTADSAPERAELPDPSRLKDCLVLGDRGYPSTEVFSRYDEAGGFFVMRLTKSWKPQVQGVYVNGKLRVLAPVALEEFLSENLGLAHDLAVSFAKERHKRWYRLVVVPNTSKRKMKKPAKRDEWVRLCTNLSASDFRPDLIGQLYRFRWQIELVFKEWKSYANLHRFDTGNHHIVEGLIWGSLCAAVVKRFMAHAAQRQLNKPVSTRRVAMCARHFLSRLLTVFTGQDQVSQRRVWAEIVGFIAHNGLRSDPKRERRKGRLQAGFVEVLAA